MKKYKCPNPDCKYTSDKAGNCCGVELVKVSEAKGLLHKVSKMVSCCHSKSKGCCE